MKSKDNTVKETLEMMEHTYYCWGEYSNGNLCPYRHSCGCYLNPRPQKASVGKMTPMQPPGNAACIFFIKAKKDKK